MNKIVYALVHPDTNLPFYIGMGNKSRPLDHFRYDVQDKNFYKLNTIKKLQSENKSIKIIILHENLSRKDAFIYESIYILLLGRKTVDNDGILTNIQPGGCGNWNKESDPVRYIKVADHCRRINLDPEIRKKNSDAQKRNISKNPMSVRHSWKRWYISPHGCFTSRNTLDLIGFNLNICHPKTCDNLISKISYGQCPALNTIFTFDQCKGNTYREMGFYFKSLD